MPWSVVYFAQAVEVAFGRGDATRGPGDRLHDDGGNGFGAVQRDEAQQLVGKLCPPFRLADREGLFVAIIGGRKMIDVRQQRAEGLAVVEDAAHRHATEADAVIAALATDEPRAVAFVFRAVVGERDLHRGVDGFAARIGEEDVVEVAGGEKCQSRGQLEHLRVGELEAWGVVETSGCGLDRLHDRLPAVAGVDAIETGSGVDDVAAVRRRQMHPVGGCDEARRSAESAVGRERQPKAFELVGVHLARGHGNSGIWKAQAYCGSRRLRRTGRPSAAIALPLSRRRDRIFQAI